MSRLRRTLGSYDDILRDKMKTLVFSSSTVKRMNLEDDTKSSISYEAFVEELDVCDSFTSTMVDILVKEIADRRTRHSAPDRRLISQQTADSLRSQCALKHVYRRESRHSRPSRMPPPSSFSFVSTLSDEEDGVDQLEPFEGARLNTELYEAHLPLGLESSREPAWRGEVVTSPRPRPFSPAPSLSSVRNNPFGLSDPSLLHQDILRRRAEFNEHTIRRRPLTRQYPRNRSSVHSEDSVEGPSRASEQEAPSMSRRRPRRFFPLAAWSDPHLRIDATDNSTGGSTLIPSHPPANPSPGGQSSAQLWYTLTGTSPTSISHDLTVLERDLGSSARPDEMTAAEFLLHDSLSQSNPLPLSPLRSPVADLPNHVDHREEILTDRTSGDAQEHLPGTRGDDIQPVAL
ncbi:hypothetical protein EIP86_003947 [Pleurotus ostreatoroseus]|nr:hypothetical protein EIP86_003947 [Pleurotus ostreatoroseus]